MVPISARLLGNFLLTLSIIEAGPCQSLRVMTLTATASKISLTRTSSLSPRFSNLTSNFVWNITKAGGTGQIGLRISMKNFSQAHVLESSRMSWLHCEKNWPRNQGRPPNQSRPQLHLLPRRNRKLATRTEAFWLTNSSTAKTSACPTTRASAKTRIVLAHISAGIAAKITLATLPRARRSPRVSDWKGSRQFNLDLKI